MASSGRWTSGTISIGTGIFMVINWTQTNLNPQNESFDIAYNIQASYSSLSGFTFRNPKLTFKYTIDENTVAVINNKNITVNSSDTTVASGTITIKPKNLTNLNFSWNVDCVITYQQGLEILGNINWDDYTSSIYHTFNIDGFSSPSATNIISILEINENTCDATTFTIKAPYPNLKYKISVDFKNFSKVILNNKTLTNTKITYTPPVSWLDLMPNVTKTFEPVITIIAYNNNGKQIGHSYKFNLTLIISEDVKPKITGFNLEKLSDIVPQNWDLLIQGLSKARVQFNCIPSRGTTISKYYLSSSLGVISNNDEIITDIITTSGTVKFTAYVIDSRGRKSVVETFNVQVVPYSKPIITEYFAKRCNNQAEYKDDGTYILAKLNGVCSSCSGKNSIINFKIKVIKNTDNSIICNDVVLPNQEVLLNGQYDPEYSYTATFSITDYFFTSQISVLVSTTNATLDLLKGGKGIAFGKVAEIEGFECEYDAKFNNNIYLIVDGLQKELRSVLKEIDDTKMSLSRIINSTNITEEGYIMDGKTLSEELFNIRQTLNQLNL